MALIQSPDLLLDQLNTVHDVYQKDYVNIDRSIRLGLTALEFESIHNLYAIGDGDSYYAALASEFAFVKLAPINYKPLPAMQFMEYIVDYIGSNSPRDTLILGISASGTSKYVVRSIEKARLLKKGFITAGLVGIEESALAKSGDKTLSVKIPELGRSPGLRTYAASLMGLFSLAIRIGEIKRHITMGFANDLRNEIVQMASIVEKTFKDAIRIAFDAAKICQSAPFLSFAGSGPSYGTASFLSAKIIEAGGVFSTAQDLEEWAHVERFAYPTNYPVIIVAPPGRGYERAVDLAKGVKAIGHPLLSVIDSEDVELKKLSDIAFEVRGKVREEFSPLVYYISGSTMAYALAKLLNRNLFMTDNEEILNAVNTIQRQLQG